MSEAEVRKCILNREVDDKENLLRFTEVDGIIVPDFQKKLPGRGMYISNSSSALAEAIKKRMFSKVAKKNISNENAELLEITEKLLKKKGLEVINLARKAGVLVSGFEKVKELLIKNKAEFLLEAKDAGLDGHNRILSFAKDLKLFSFYTTEELDGALDKVNTVHIAFKKSKMSETVYKELYKLDRFLNS